MTKIEPRKVIKAVEGLKDNIKAYFEELNDTRSISDVNDLIDVAFEAVIKKQK